MFRISGFALLIPLSVGWISGCKTSARTGDPSLKGNSNSPGKSTEVSTRLWIGYRRPDATTNFLEDLDSRVNALAASKEDPHAKAGQAGGLRQLVVGALPASAFSTPPTAGILQRLPEAMILEEFTSEADFRRLNSSGGALSNAALWDVFDIGSSKNVAVQTVASWDGFTPGKAYSVGENCLGSPVCHVEWLLFSHEFGADSALKDPADGAKVTPPQTLRTPLQTGGVYKVFSDHQMLGTVYFAEGFYSSWLTFWPSKEMADAAIANLKSGVGPVMLRKRVSGLKDHL